MPRTVEKQGKETSPLSKDKKISKLPKKGARSGSENSEQDQIDAGDRIIESEVGEKPVPGAGRTHPAHPKEEVPPRENIDHFINSQNPGAQPNIPQMDIEPHQKHPAPNQRREEEEPIINDEAEDGENAGNDNLSDSQEQHQEQSDEIEGQQNSNSASSPPIIPAIKDMKFRQVRGTRIQDLIDGKMKLDDKNLVDQQVNKYLGVKSKRKNKAQDRADGAQHKGKKKKKVVSDSEDSVYNYNEEDSSDEEDYVQSSSGHDEFDSDFDLTESYPGKRGRKKGSKSKKRGRGRGRPPLGINRVQKPPTEKVPGRKRGRPPKIRPLQNGPRPEVEKKEVVRHDGAEGEVRVKKRGRPRKYPQTSDQGQPKAHEKSEANEIDAEERQHNASFIKHQMPPPGMVIPTQPNQMMRFSIPHMDVASGMINMDNMIYRDMPFTPEQFANMQRFRHENFDQN